MDVSVVPELAPLVAAVLDREGVEEEVWAAARRYALSGEPLQILLDDVDTSLVAAAAGPADAPLLRMVAVAWSEVFLAQFDGVSCVDPLTGLETRQHLLRHLDGLCREDAGSGWSLVVVDVRPAEADEVTSPVQAMAESMGLVQAAEVLRPIVSGDHVVALSPHRCAGLLPRESARSCAPVLRLDLTARTRRSAGPTPRVWVLEVPATASALPGFLAEAARGETPGADG